MNKSENFLTILWRYVWIKFFYESLQWRTGSFNKNEYLGSSISGILIKNIRRSLFTNNFAEAVIQKILEKLEAVTEKWSVKVTS